MAKRRVARPRRDWTAEELRARVDYDPETGKFTRKPYELGTVQYFGKTRMPAVTISLRTEQGTYRHYYAHRLAWLWMTGEWPAHEIDHINGKSTDNRWANLREATHTENNRNKSFASYTKSGLIGASLHKASGLWRATLRHKTIGYFKTAEEAHEAYKKAARELYGEFAHSAIKPDR